MIITIPTSLNSSVVNLVIQTLSLKSHLKNITEDFTTQEITNICVISMAGNFGIDKNLPCTGPIIQETNLSIVEFAALLHLLIAIDLLTILTLAARKIHLNVISVVACTVIRNLCQHM